MFEWVHYQFPSRVFFESDSSPRIGTVVKDIGERVLIISSRDEITNPEHLKVIQESLIQHTSGCILYDDISGVADYAELDTAAHFAKQCNADTILAYGGRNSLNTARVVALLSKNEIFAQELPRAGLPLKEQPLPVVTVPVGPTIGEECVPSFFLFDSETRSSFHSIDYRLFPALIFLDPAVTGKINNTEFIRNAFAVLASSVESILSRRSNDITNSMALRAIELVYRSITAQTLDQSSTTTLMNISLASLLAGMSHSNSSVGVSYVVAMVTHNLLRTNFETVMSIVLPHVMEYNLTGAAAKYVSIARALDESTTDVSVIEAAIKAVEGVKKIMKKLKVPERLAEFDIKKADLSRIAQQAAQNPLLINAPRDLDKSEIEAILIAAF